MLGELKPKGPKERPKPNEFSCPCEEKAIFADLTYFPRGVASFLGHHDVIHFKTEAVRLDVLRKANVVSRKSIGILGIITCCHCCGYNHL